MSITRLHEEHELTGLDAVLALGMFDGVHLGHQAILSACCELAMKLQGTAVLYSYENAPHPDKEGTVQGPLTTLEEKLALAEQLGFTHALIRPFDLDYASLSPQAFIDLFVAAGVKAVVCGRDYRFGAGGRAEVRELESLCGAAGIQVQVVEDVMAGAERISSTAIRALLLEGDCDQASWLLGRPYSLAVRFQGGRALWPQKARVHEGIYACQFCGHFVQAEVDDGEITLMDGEDLLENHGEIAFISALFDR